MTRNRLMMLVAAAAVVAVLMLGFIIAPHFGVSNSDGVVLAIGLSTQDRLRQLANAFLG